MTAAYARWRSALAALFASGAAVDEEQLHRVLVLYAIA